MRTLSSTSVGLALVQLLLLQERRVQGFTTSTGAGAARCSPFLTRLFADNPDTSPRVRTKPKTPEEILAEQGQTFMEAPKIFEESLYDDLQEMLLALETRVNNGPGALSLLDIDHFEFQAKRVQAEMREFAANGGVTTLAPPAPPATPAVVPPPPPPPPAAAAQAPTLPQASATPPPRTEEPTVTDTSEDDGPAYDGTGGFGLARGTTNTYVIPGMDSMSPEEYQKALQESITNRQNERKAGGNYGNRQSWDYLNNLGAQSGFRPDQEGHDKWKKVE